MDFSNYLNPVPEYEKQKTSSDLSAVFLGRERSYLNYRSLFVAYFGQIPNSISMKGVDCAQSIEWLENELTDEIKENFYAKKKSGNSRPDKIYEKYYLLFDDLLLLFDFEEKTARILFKNTDERKVEAVIQQLQVFQKKKRAKNPELHLLVSTNYGLDLKGLQITKPKLKIADNYNDDFIEIHKTIHKRLSKKNDKGLVLLHGKPGTGKTSYIRYLISSLKKKVIFLPPNLASAITNPELLSVLIDEPNSVFVIEDAENIIIDREIEGSSPVSALLNLSDGLLSDCLNIQIICSFNTDLSKVDSALLRKGRLIAQYEFKELETEKAQKLSDKLGFRTAIIKPMTLTDIYNQEEMNFENSKGRVSIGFTSN